MRALQTVRSAEWRASFDPLSAFECSLSEADAEKPEARGIYTSECEITGLMAEQMPTSGRDLHDRRFVQQQRFQGAP